MNQNDQDENENIDADTASFFKAIGNALLLTAIGGLVLFLCAWSVNVLWSAFS